VRENIISLCVEVGWIEVLNKLILK